MPSVDAQAVASVVADWTGIPVGRMVKNELQAILQLGEALGKRVIGQQHGLDMIARRIQTSRARLDNPNKPIGVFMLCGTSGVGKTETALALAEALYGGEQNVITINMSEFQEAHTVSSLKGAPPGYVGYGEGGILTEAVRRRPYSVVLLDEVEKAHPDVHELFFQVFDKGRMEDGEGRMIDFKNTIILLTSNAGSELVMNMCKDPELLPDPESLATAMAEPLQKIFPPALLGRLVVIPYYPLSDDMLGQIVRLQLNRIKKRVAENHKIPFEYSDDAVSLIVKRCNNAESAAASSTRSSPTPCYRRFRSSTSGERPKGASYKRCAWALPRTISPTPSSRAIPPETSSWPSPGLDAAVAALNIKAAEGEFLVLGLTGHEHLGRMFEYVVELAEIPPGLLAVPAPTEEGRPEQAYRHGRDDTHEGLGG